MSFDGYTEAAETEVTRLREALRAMVGLFGHPLPDEYVDGGASYKTACEIVATARAALAAAPQDEAADLIERLSRAKEELERALQGMLDEWDRLTRYGSPMAKAANPRVNAARAILAALPKDERVT